MFRLTNAFVFALLGSVSAGPLSLKRSLAAGDHAPIAGFNPLTDVRDQVSNSFIAWCFGEFSRIT